MSCDKLLRLQRRFVALQVKITWETFLARRRVDSLRVIGNIFFCHKVFGVSVLSFKGDKVLQEVSTSRFWFKEGYFVVKFDRFEQGFHQRVFFDLFVQGFSVRVLLSSRISSTSLLIGLQVSGLLGCNRQKIYFKQFLGIQVLVLEDKYSVPIMTTVTTTLLNPLRLVLVLLPLVELILSWAFSQILPVEIFLAARQMSLSAEVRMRAEYNIMEKRRLKYVVENQGELLKAREEEIESLKAQLLLKKAEAAEAICLHAEALNFKTVKQSLRDETDALRERNIIFEKEQNALDVKVIELETSVLSKEREFTDLNALVTSVKSQNDNLIHELEISFCGLQENVTVYENCMEQLKKFQDDRMKAVNDKFDKLYTDFVEMALHLEEKFYPHLFTTISGHKWLLTQGMKLAIIKCLNSPKCLFALGAAIGKAIKKGMQDGLSAVEGLQTGLEFGSSNAYEGESEKALRDIENNNRSQERHHMINGINRIIPLLKNRYDQYSFGCIEGNVTASKPKTLEEAINISQRLMDQLKELRKKNPNTIELDYYDDVDGIDDRDDYDLICLRKHISSQEVRAVMMMVATFQLCKTRAMIILL
nr:hypothetical protein [Tanacetum cinerariifolium]